MKIKINPDGTMTFVYSDQLRPLFDEGEAQIKRASHVEPTDDGRWQADLSPVGGPVLAATDQRSDSLAAEVEWLDREILS